MTPASPEPAVQTAPAAPAAAAPAAPTQRPEPNNRPAAGNNPPRPATELAGPCEEAFREAEKYCRSPIEGSGQALNFATILQMGGLAGEVLSAMSQQGAMTARAAGESIRGQCEKAKMISAALGALNGGYSLMCGRKRAACTEACTSYRRAMRNEVVAPARQEERDAQAALNRHNNTRRPAEAGPQQQQWDETQRRLNAALNGARIRRQDANGSSLTDLDTEQADRWLNTCQNTFGNNVTMASQQALRWGNQFAQASQCQDVAQTVNCALARDRDKPECQNDCRNPALQQSLACQCERNPNFSPACPRRATPIAQPQTFCDTPEGKTTPQCICRDPEMANTPECRQVANTPYTGGGTLDTLSGVTTPNSLSNDIAALTTPENNLGDGDGRAQAVAALAAQARPGGLGMPGQFGLQGSGNNRAGGRAGGPGSDLDRGFRTQGGMGGGAIPVTYASQGGRGLSAGDAGKGDGEGRKPAMDLTKFLPAGRDGFAPPAADAGVDGITPANGLTIWQKISRRYNATRSGLRGW